MALDGGASGTGRLAKGLPSVITGESGEIGGKMKSDPIVRKLTFTGLTETGGKLMAACDGTSEAGSPARRFDTGLP